METLKQATITDTEALSVIAQEQARRGDKWPASTATKMVLEYRVLQRQGRIPTPAEPQSLAGNPVESIQTGGAKDSPEQGDSSGTDAK